MALREVDFHSYCGKCKWKTKDDNEPPCDECMAVSAREDSRKPLKFRHESGGDYLAKTKQ